MKLLLIYPPFCTPTMMPYSISYLKSFVESNSDIEVKALDLNAKFHKLRFKRYYDKLNKEEHGNLLTEFYDESKEVYAKNHREIVMGKEPELIDEMLQIIEKEKPTHIAFSIVYNSQNFYTDKLIDRLDIPIITGGEAVCKKVRKKTISLKNEIELLEFFNIKPKNLATMPDFSDYDKNDYLTKDIIIPVKSSTSCYYKRCTFCTHHKSLPYHELPIDNLTESRNYFFIDDMIPLKRLLQISNEMKRRKARWSVQLRPSKEIIPHLKELSSSGLRSVAWGVESGNDDILKKMQKGTNAKDIADVLKESKKHGIINMAFIMFGFPTETKEQFIDTIDFLKGNKDNIDLISVSIFGLQEGSLIYENPKKFGIISIRKIKRTVLDDQIEYECADGLTQQQARRLRSRYSKTIRNIESLPRVLNYLKDQTLFF